jgi:hypothetical protein
MLAHGRDRAKNGVDALDQWRRAQSGHPAGRRFNRLPAVSRLGNRQRP